jgi:hypothetical protein
LSESFRVNIDNLTKTWRLKPIDCYEFVEFESQIKKSNTGYNLKYKSTSIENLNSIDSTKIEGKTTISTSNNNYLKCVDCKKRSSSTSYLTNDEDDCDEFYNTDEDSIKFRRQLSLDAKLEEVSNKDNSADEQNETSSNLITNDYSLKIKKKNTQTSASSSSNEENSDFSDDDEIDSLYSIDEGIESLKDADIDSSK